MTIEISLDELKMLERATRFVISDNIQELAWQEDEATRKRLNRDAHSYDKLRKKLNQIIINTSQNGKTT